MTVNIKRCTFPVKIWPIHLVFLNYAKTKKPLSIALSGSLEIYV